MTAGRGIVHSEMPEQEDGLMWGFQLWVNLPAKDKMMKPRYQDIQGDQVPEVELGPGARARVLVGTVNGVKGPVDGGRDRSALLRLCTSSRTRRTPRRCPRGTTRSRTSIKATRRSAPRAPSIASQEMALLTRGASLPVTAGEQGARLIVVAGRPLNEPVARYGPFVMNTVEEIHQAFADYQAGRSSPLSAFTLCEMPKRFAFLGRPRTPRNPAGHHSLDVEGEHERAARNERHASGVCVDGDAGDRLRSAIRDVEVLR